MNDPSFAYFGIRNDLADRLLKASHQLAGVPQQNRSGVLAAALDAVPEAAQLLRPYPILFADGDSAASRLAYSCLTASATFPGARRDQIADLGALTMILFGMDDVADGIAGDWSDHEVGAFFESIGAVLAGAQPEVDAADVRGQVLHAWSGWCDRFRGHPGAAVHTPNLLRQLELAGAAMALERAWATGGEPWPDYGRYLANGAPTILYPTWWAAALGIRGPVPADAGHWESMEQATLLGAACMRLANDIRTFERERREGKPNSVLILEHGGMSTEAAVERVSAQVADLNAEFAAALADLPGELAGIAEGQHRCVSFNGAWYRSRDTHAYTVQELAKDVETHRAD
ncbi:terpene synthase family protein [Nonomuraea sp. B12E4]|uniref:terpene synthase family protein n=1 Tax=Nonomuraea sp. B12E4 TaxID=3153564 RepID=UPI00325D1034